MVKHHTSYETNETAELSKGDHFRIHRETCDLCYGVSVNLLHGSFNIDPITYFKTGESTGCSVYTIRLCHNCWERVLGIEGLIIRDLFKNSWQGGMHMTGSEEKRKNFVREYLRRYPMKFFMSLEEHNIREDGYLKKINPQEE